MNFEAKVYEQQNFHKLVVGPEALRHREFSGCNFKHCEFGAADLSSSSFLDCRFDSCSFAATKLDHCHFKGVHFKDCKFVGINFCRVEAFLLQWSFGACKLEFCQFGGLKMAHSEFEQCVLLECDFVNADLRESSLCGCELRGSKFHHTQLEKADLSGARNYQIDPSSNRIKGAKFSYPEALNLLAAFEITIEA